MSSTVRTTSAPSAPQAGPHTGTGTLLRFMLRRDRLRLPLWVLGLTALMAYFANALGTVMDEESLEATSQLVASPITALIGGPGYGFDDITLLRFLAGLYGLYIMVGAAFMGITTISRHTRAEEQSGRAELIQANVVGRHAQLTAALILAVGMSLLVSVLTTLVLLGSVIDPRPEVGSTLLFGFSIGAVGVAFAGIAAVTVQLSPFSRTCTSISGVVLALAFVVRGVGDMSAVQNGNLAWLSWLSPLGWSQQTAPYTLDRWWPLLLSLAFAAVMTTIGFLLQARRDLGAGVLADRPGRNRAPVWLGSPLGLAFRLQRAGIIGWSVGVFVAGVIFGAFSQPMNESMDGMPEEILAVMGGADGLVEGYLGFMGLYFGVIIGVYAILTVQNLRGEEQGIHTEPVIATSVSRPGWLLSWLAVAGIGGLWLCVLAGLAEGLGAAISTGNWSLFGPVLLGHGVQFAVVWFLMGLAAAVYGLAPRLVGIIWVVVVYGTVLSMFGPMLELDEAVLNTSPFEHVGQHPATDISWTSVTVLAGAGIILSLVGAVFFRRRDLITV